MSNWIKLGKEAYNVAFLRRVTEDQAIKMLPHLDRNQVINAWKQANGLTKRTHAKVEVVKTSTQKRKSSDKKS